MWNASEAVVLPFAWFSSAVLVGTLPQCDPSLGAWQRWEQTSWFQTFPVTVHPRS